MLSNTIVTFIEELKIGKIKHYKNMVLFPIFSKSEFNTNYFTLGEALLQELLEISEVNSSGSVPELKVINLADVPVLILDGEELKGAKQNRIINTTVLIKEKSVTIIPVSCTEQGRWSYKSNFFKESGNIFSPKMRGAKAENISYSLKETGHFMSNQGEVWNNIRNISNLLKVKSETEAMSDVYNEKRKSIYEYTESFDLETEQIGLCVFISGKLIGIDIIPDNKIYSKFHRKLVSSYALDAIVEESLSDNILSRSIVHDFFNEIENSREDKFKSIGYGWDHRLKSNSLVGSALIHNDKIIHLACFRIPDIILKRKNLTNMII